MKSQNIDAPYKNRSRIKESFVILESGFKIESQLNANYSFDNFLEGDANRLAQQVWLSQTNQVELHSTIIDLWWRRIR
jgi:chromosomal replication initiator protein